MERDVMEYDVLVVGAGPAGLSTAIKFAQLNKKNNTNHSICVIEKGSEVGAHILSGNVFEPTALNELIPDWKEKEAPLDTPVKKDVVKYLINQNISIPIPLPAILMPNFNNHGNYIMSLANFCRWLAKEAESLGVEIFPGFTASEELLKMISSKELLQVKWVSVRMVKRNHHINQVWNLEGNIQFCLRVVEVILENK